MFSTPLSRGSAANATLGNTINVSPTIVFPVGSILFVDVAFDNISIVDGAGGTNVTISDTQGNTWQRVDEYTNTQAGVAADGMTIATFWTKVATELQTSDLVTATFSTDVAAKAISISYTTVSAGNTIQLVGSNFFQGSGTTISVDIQGLTDTEHLYVLRMAEEGNNTNSQPITNYSELSRTFADGGSAQTSAILRRWNRVLTGTGDTLTAAGSFVNSRDKAVAFYAFEEVSEQPNVSPDTPTVTIDSTTARTVQLHTSAFSDSDVSQVQEALRVKLIRNSDLSVIEDRTLGAVTTYNSATYNPNMLPAGEQINYEVYHKDNSGAANAWSAAATGSFTTKNMPVLSKVSPTAASFTISDGTQITFSVTGTDHLGNAIVGTDVNWSDSIEGALSTGLQIIEDFTNGTHTLTSTYIDPVTNDTISVSWNFTVGGSSGTIIKGRTMEYSRENGVATEVLFRLYDSLGDPVQPTLATGDVKISKDGGATFADITTLPTPAGTLDMLAVLTVSEMTAANNRPIVVQVVDQTVPAAWKADTFYIATYNDDQAVHTNKIPELGTDDLPKVSVDSQTDIAVATRTNLATELGRIDAPISGVPAAVRTNLATELGRIDAAVSSRATSADITTKLNSQGLTTSVVSLLRVASLLSAGNWTRIGNTITLSDGTVLVLNVQNNVVMGLTVTLG